MIPIIYYAHSMENYGTEKEREELRQLEQRFPNALIYNPNRPYIQFHKESMKACLQIVDDPWITGIAFSHTDKIISCGVYAEIRCAQKRHKPIYIIEKDRIQVYFGMIKLIKEDRKTRWAEV